MKKKPLLERLFRDKKQESKANPEAKLMIENLEARLLYSAAPADGGAAPEAESAPEPAQQAPAAPEQQSAAPQDVIHEAPDGAESILETEVNLLPDEAEMAGSSAEEAPAAEQEAAIEEENPMEVVGESLLEVDELGQFSDEAPGSEVNQEVVHWMAEAAAERWEMTGLSDEQIAALANVTYELADLGGLSLAYFDASANIIRIDDDAAGMSWFIDSTPLDDVEFISAGPSHELVAATGEAEDRADLLTVILHEQGHVLGLLDSQEGLMNEFLGAGERRILSEGLAEGADPNAIEGIHHLIAEANVSPGELSGMQLLYSRSGFTNFDNADDYNVDNSGSIATGSYDRVAYYLELDSYWVWVSMDAFNTDPTLVGVPADGSGIVENGTVVTNLVIESNHPNVTSRSIDTGIIEFWASNYGGDGGGLFNSTTAFDWKDSGGSTSSGHGSMQVADITPLSEKMIFSITGSGIGIGSQPSGNPDWTFGPNYIHDSESGSLGRKRK